MTVQDVIENIQVTLDRVTYHGDVLTREVLIEILKDLRNIDESSDDYWLVLDGVGEIVTATRNHDCAASVAREYDHELCEVRILSRERFYDNF